MQYLESPPVMVADPNVLVAKSGDTTGVNTANGPRVEFSYEYYDGNTAALPNSGWTLPGNPPAGAIKRRHCYITGLNSDQEAQIAYGATVVLPTLGAWSRLADNPPGSGTASAVVNNNPRTLEVYLEVYPDALLGAASNDPTSNLLYRTYHFGIYGPPVPVLGEPTVPLPKNIAIDFAVSLVPYAGTPGRNYDVLFAPSGQMMSTYGTSGGINGTGALYLWVRDYTKVATMVQGGAALAAAFRQGGEQQVVAVRNGFIGTAPVNWPDSSGNFDPFALARQRLD
jgi:hypothetical protein